VVDSSILQLLLAGLLKLQLLIEREDGTLGGAVDVACSSAAAAELGGALGETVLEVRSRAASSGAVGGLGGLEVIASSTSTCVCVAVHAWVRLNNLEVGWHFEVI
jgi:hypothetical protein